MKNVDDTYKSELNFVDEFNLSHNGMIKEIKTEFDIIQFCISQLSELNKEQCKILDRVIIMPLRKLLCESNSVLLTICPTFKMPKLQGIPVQLSDNQYVIRPPYFTSNEDEWIPISDWLNQKISWFDRTVAELPDMLPKFTYEYIIKRLNDKKFKSYKQDFEAKFYSEDVMLHNSVCTVYRRINPEKDSENQYIFDVLEKIGFNTLTVYTFLKHLSDKRGAHIDLGHSYIMQVINTPDSLQMTPIHYFAAQMIFAAKIQIPELSNYWPQMPDLRT